MISQRCFAVSLLTIMTFLANEPLATAQRGTFSLPPAVPLPPSPAIGSDRVVAKPIVVADLVEKLRTANIGERLEIIQQLSDTEQNIVPELVRAMDDPDPLVKSGVAEVLGNLTDAAVPAIPVLISMMNDGRRAIVPESRLVAPYPYLPAIAPLPPPLPRPANVKERRLPPTSPQNPENLLRITAIVAIGKIGLPARTAATPFLTQALQDPDPWVKLNATWALAEIGASVPLLPYWLEALQHPDPNLRRSAAASFSRLRLTSA
jgi:HEAT repeat protein